MSRSSNGGSSKHSSPLRATATSMRSWRC